MRRYAVTVLCDLHNARFTRRFFTRFLAVRYFNMINNEWPSHYRAEMRDS